MKTARKFTTFEDLKSSEKKPLDYISSLKKHSDFEKIMKSFRSIIHNSQSEKTI